MRYAVISDIHANLQALEAVLADSSMLECGTVVCLGDIVGGGKNPKECLDLVRTKTRCCVKGEFDDYCATGSAPPGHDEKMAKDIREAHSKLTDEDCQWLRRLPATTEIDGFTMVHGTLDPSWQRGWIYGARDARGSFGNQKTPLCFFGRIHVPLAFVCEPIESGQPIVKGGTFKKIRVDSGKKYLMNPGSVGQPRDNNPKAAYAIYDMDQKIIELRRIDYDWEAAQEA